MRLETGKTGSGKSHSLLIGCANKNGQLVVSSFLRRDFYETYAKNLGLSIKDPILFDQFLELSLEKKKKEVFFFDIEEIFYGLDQESTFSIFSDSIVILKRDTEKGQFVREVIKGNDSTY